MKRLVLFRTYIGIDTLQMVDLSFNEEQSRVWSLMQAGGIAARIGTLLIAVLAVTALLDVVFNDALPWLSRLAAARHRRLCPTGSSSVLCGGVCRVLIKGRGMTWMLLALAYVSQSVVALMHGFAPRIAGLYFVSGVFCAAVAWLDNHYRFVAVQQDLRETGHGELRA